LFFGVFRQIGRKFEKETKVLNTGQLFGNCRCVMIVGTMITAPHTLIQSAIVLLNIVCVLFLSLLRQQEEK
jgi:hypothetical protein